jgi:hypothetical protein
VLTHYDTLTDEELLRFARDHEGPLLRALIERLEMRIRDIEEFNRPTSLTNGDLDD